MLNSNKIFQKIFVLLFLFWPFTIICQNNNPNDPLDTYSAPSFAYLTVIDGKIPYSVLSKLSFKHNKLNDTVIYNCYYINNRHYSENLMMLDSIPDSVTVSIDVFFEEPIGYNKAKMHHYHDEMPLGRLKLVQILSITNFRHKQYYMHYVFDPPLRTYPLYERRFGNKNKFYSRVFSCFYPYSYNKWSKGGRTKPSY